MKIFRRILLYVPLTVMTASLLLQCIQRKETDYDTSVSVFYWFVGLLGVLVWCAVYLKAEPTLARIALAIAISTLVVVGCWAFIGAFSD